jgi:hypothetical protein
VVGAFPGTGMDYAGDEGGLSAGYY